MCWSLKNLNLFFQKSLSGLFFILIGCSGETLFVSGTIAEKANQILPPLEKLIQLKINQNQLITERNDLNDDANQLVIQINKTLNKQNPLILEAYQIRERGGDESRLLNKSNQINTDADQLRSRVDQIRERAKNPTEEIARLMQEINQVTEEVRLAIEEAERLDEKFPANFTKALELVKTANKLRYKARQLIAQHNKLVAEHNQIISKVDQLVRERKDIYLHSNRLASLRNNFNEQEQFKRGQEQVINNLKKNRSEEIDLRKQEVNALKEALQLLKTVSQPTEGNENKAEGQ